MIQIYKTTNKEAVIIQYKKHHNVDLLMMSFVLKSMRLYLYMD